MQLFHCIPLIGNIVGSFVHVEVASVVSGRVRNHARMRAHVDGAIVGHSIRVVVSLMVRWWWQRLMLQLMVIGHVVRRLIRKILVVLAVELITASATVVAVGMLVAVRVVVSLVVVIAVLLLVAIVLK